MHGLIDEWMHKLMDGWINKWLNKWIDESINEWVNENNTWHSHLLHACFESMADFMCCCQLP